MHARFVVREVSWRVWSRLIARPTRFGELYVIAVPESTGAAATVTLTVTGAATETGTVNVYVGRTPACQAP
ncbi:hypothetical protein [Escherichia coli]|uniref:hypothetical protein n=1 Tax=Escherichia coli TaxID=562 RepID=UPI00202031DC|nr:hypothetical protein [Escherichia coli]